MTASATPPDATIAGWDEFVERLRTLPGRMLAKLPERLRQDPQTQQEIGRLALEALASSTLGLLAGDPDHPAFVAQIGEALNVGQPNADTVYRVAQIAPDGVYRLCGRRGALRMFNISQSPPSPGEPGFEPENGNRTAHDFNALKVDGRGRFEVMLSPDRPAGWTGEWWRLEPTTNKLLMRMVSADWATEEAPTVSIERLDRPVGRPRRPADELEAKLRRLPAAVDFIALLFVDHVEQLRRAGFVNRLRVFDVSQMGGLAGQFYYEGAYDLAEDEALILEATVPARCSYRSLILTNWIYETTDWINNHASLNDAQAPVDADGVWRVVVSAKDPGAPNWLDTSGYPQGLIQGRWFGCDGNPTPSIRKVSLAEVRRYLPAQTPTITPEARDRIIRERRAAYQQRPLW